jgi:hypothetical protein
VEKALLGPQGSAVSQQTIRPEERCRSPGQYSGDIS